MDAELRFHLERQTEENIRCGMGPEEAWRAARRSFGGVIAFTLVTTLIVTLFFGRFLANQLFGVTPADPTTFIGVWQKSFGGDPYIIGRTISINGPGVTVIGVLPPDFQLLLPEETHPSLTRADQIKAWELFQFDLATFPRESNFLAAIGRLKPEVSIEQARSEMETIAARLRSEHAGHRNRNTQIRATPLHKDIVKHVRPSLVALFVAASLLLLIACADVANMLMARDVGRRREFAIRAAIGASRAQIMRQLMTENLFLAMIGGVIGLLLARWGLDLLPLLQLENVPRLQAVALNAKAFGFAAAVCLLSAILFGLTPALPAQTYQRL